MGKKEDLVELHKIASNIRGQMLDRVVMMERCVDTYLATYFSNTGVKINEMFNLLWCTDRITLKNKYLIFEWLIKEHEKSFLKQYPTVLFDYNFVSEQRNIFAHYLLDDSADALKNSATEFRFIKFKNVRSYEIYDVERIDDIYQKVNSVIEALATLIPKEVTTLSSNLSGDVSNKSSQEG